jgi:hypothetical protein
MRIIEGGESPPADWPVAILQVVRNTNEEIIVVPLSTAAKEDIHQTEPQTGTD